MYKIIDMCVHHGKTWNLSLCDRLASLGNVQLLEYKLQSINLKLQCLEIFLLPNYEPREKLSRFFTISLCRFGNFQYLYFQEGCSPSRPGSSIPLCRAAVQHPNPRASVPVHSLTSVPAMAQAVMTSAPAVLLIYEHLPPTYDCRKALGK